MKMDKDLKRRLIEKLKKNRYIILIITVGIIVLLIPTSSSKKSSSESQTAQESTVINSFSIEEQEQKLEEILSKIGGVGEVSVMLTLKTSEEQIVAENEEYDSSDTDESGSSETVIVTDADGNENVVTIKYISPEYEGAVVVAEGAANAEVRLIITKAVMSVTGLGSDKITVTN